MSTHPVSIRFARGLCGVLLACIVLLTCAQAKAQPADPWGREPSYAGWHGLGVKAGGLWSTVVGNTVKQPEGKVGWSAAAVAGYRFLKHGRLRVELQFSQRGARHYLDDLGSVDMRLRFLEIPLIVDCLLPLRGDSLVSAYAGAAKSWTLSAEVTGDNGSLDSEGLVLDSELSFLAGVTGELELGSGRLVLDLRAMLATTGIIADPSPWKLADVRNRSLMVLVGYSFL